MKSLEMDYRSKALQSGQLFGKFYLLDLVGEGGTAKVFKALQQPINRVVALKIPEFAVSGEILTPDDFLAEATAMARLEHDNIIRIYDFGLVDNQPFICMEYVEEGYNASELVERAHPLPEGVLLSMLLQSWRAIQFAHSKGVLHRDLSPNNLLVSREGVVKLSDFGMTGRKKKLASGMSQVVGTPAFLSPEHVRKEPCTPGSDVFSFGSLVYYLYSGAFLFDATEHPNGFGHVLDSVAVARESPPLHKLEGLPEELAGLIRHCLSGGDGLAVAGRLQDLWNRGEFGGDPVRVLGRFLGSDPKPDLNALKSRYLELRRQGHHRQAIALLENALTRDPGNTGIQRLLTKPWQGTNSVQTMGVEDHDLSTSHEEAGNRLVMNSTQEVWAEQKATSESTSNVPPVSVQEPNLDSKPLQRSGHALLITSRSRYLFPMTVLFLVGGALSWFLLKPDGLNQLQLSTSANISEKHAGAPPLLPEREPYSPSPSKSPTPPAEPHSAKKAPTRPAAAPKAGSNSAKVQKKASSLGASSQVASNALSTDSRKVAKSTTEEAIATSAANEIQHAPPNTAFLRLGSLAGVEIVVNDTLGFTSPSPLAGWRLEPGLIRIELRHPSFASPISSSLFLKHGGHYAVHIEEGGKFMVETLAK